MVREDRLPRFRIGLEQREVDDPAERMRQLGLRCQPPDDFLANFVECGRRHPIGADRHERDVTVAHADAAERIGREVLAHRARDLLSLALDPRQPGRAVGLRRFSQLIDVLAG